MKLSFRNARNIKHVTLTDCMLTLDEFIAIAKFGAKVEFSPEMQEIVRANRRLLDQFLAEGRIIYGVTTGFGENVRYTIRPRTPPPCRKVLSAPTLWLWVSRFLGFRPAQSCSRPF